VSASLDRYTAAEETRGPHNSAQGLADEITKAFGRRIRFGHLMALIRDKGQQNVRETFKGVLLKGAAIVALPYC
jgi:hypothetical protein